MTLLGSKNQTEMSQNNHLVLICSCNSSEHQILFHKSNGNEWFPPEVYAHVHLVRRSFWYRLKYGLKYIFGYKSKYGAWDEFILDKSHIQDLQAIIKHLEDETVSSATSTK